MIGWVLRSPLPESTFRQHAIQLKKKHGLADWVLRGRPGISSKRQPHRLSTKSVTNDFWHCIHLADHTTRHTLFCFFFLVWRASFAISWPHITSVPHKDFRELCIHGLAITAQDLVVDCAANPELLRTGGCVPSGQKNDQGPCLDPARSFRNCQAKAAFSHLMVAVA